MIRFLLLLIGLFLVFPATAAPNGWGPYFSEEPPGQHVCPGGIEAVRCRGRFCDNIGLYCKAGTIGARAGTWSNWISEERPKNSFKCPTGTVATGMRCEGGYCDNVSLRCDPVDSILTNCTWSTWISEESGADRRNWINWPNRFLAGMQCSGSNCDNKRFYHCEMRERTSSLEVEKPDIEWRIGIKAIGQSKSPTAEIALRDIDDPAIGLILSSTLNVDALEIQYRGEKGVIDQINKSLESRNILSDPLRVKVYPPSNTPKNTITPAHFTVSGYDFRRRVVTISAKIYWPKAGQTVIRYLVMTEGFADADLDGYAPCPINHESIGGIGGVELHIPNVCGDCDDFNPSVFPGQSEICGDNIDNNCNGQVDEGC